MGQAVKLSSELVEAAEHEARLFSRSKAGQIEHWARIGRAVESSPTVDVARVRAALNAELRFDELNADERPMALADLEAQLHMPDGDRTLQRELLEAGRAYSAVVDGELVVIEPPGGERR